MDFQCSMEANDSEGNRDMCGGRLHFGGRGLRRFERHLVGEGEEWFWISAASAVAMEFEKQVGCLAPKHVLQTLRLRVFLKIVLPSCHVTSWGVSMFGLPPLRVAVSYKRDATSSLCESTFVICNANGFCSGAFWK